MHATSIRRLEPTDLRTPSRVFLVGCPRSGTTLLQSLLLGHPEVVSFPETFFFTKATPKRQLPRVLGLTSRDTEAAYGQLEESGLLDAGERASRRMSRCAADFTASLDRAARSSGARLWVEKTPSHLHYVDVIGRHVENARFIHIIRDATGAVPSLYEVTRCFPQEWNGARSLHECIDRWRGDVRLSAAKAGQPGHAFITYESLSEHPTAALAALCELLALQFDKQTLEQMVASRGDTLNQVARNEPWKDGVSTVVQNRNLEKLRERLEPPEQTLVLAAAEAEAKTLARIPFIGRTLR